MESVSRVVLCRHGVTDFTATGKWDGRGGSNPDLNDTGRAQASELARRAAEFLSNQPVTAVFSSTLSRAKQTAQPVAEALGIEPSTDPAWDELAFGDWDGKSGKELHKTDPDSVIRFW
ncbi:MAG: bifunctional RNase H/acid phosphatase, partial [Propionibacterium sp.]